MHERGAVGREVAAFLAATAGSAVSGAAARIAPDVDPEVVLDVWRSATAGTHAAGARLDCRIAAGALQCFSCEHRYPGGKLDRCPRCGGPGLMVEPPPVFAVESWSA